MQMRVSYDAALTFLLLDV